MRCAQLPPGQSPQNLLDDVVESFVRELGAGLQGVHGSPWARTRGVLRLSQARGPQALLEEFETLRRCLQISLEVLQENQADRVWVDRAINEASEAAVATQDALTLSNAEGPALPFGGVVLEVFEPHALPVDGRQRNVRAVH